jgi:superfamily I DNA/RNA helicase
MFTAEEERKCVIPTLTRCGDDDALVTETFAKAEQQREELDSSRCDIALVAFSDDLFKKAKAYAEAHNKPVELLKQRGDIEVIKRAERSKRFVLSTPEYIGGLEFQGVVLMGVDDGRVPPTKTLDSSDSANFLSYASHNRLYVAISRARSRVEVLIVSERGPSRLLLTALKSGALRDTSEDGGEKRHVGSA